MPSPEVAECYGHLCLLCSGTKTIPWLQPLTPARHQGGRKRNINLFPQLWINEWPQRWRPWQTTTVVNQSCSIKVSQFAFLYTHGRSGLYSSLGIRKGLKWDYENIGTDT